MNNDYINNKHLTIANILTYYLIVTMLEGIVPPPLTTLVVLHRQTPPGMPVHVSERSFSLREL